MSILEAGSINDLIYKP
jgi:FlaA1/EpsC-like NDP-sugar epimerase